MARDAIQRALRRQAAAMQMAKVADKVVGIHRLAETASATESALGDKATWRQKLASVEQSNKMERLASMAETKGMEDLDKMTENTGLPQDAEFTTTSVLNKTTGRNTGFNDDPQETAVLPKAAWAMEVVDAIHALETDLERQNRQALEVDDGIAVREPGPGDQAESTEAESIVAKVSVSAVAADIDLLSAAAEPMLANQEAPVLPIDVHEVEEFIATLADDRQDILEALYENFEGREAALPGILGELFGYPAAGSRQIMSLEANVALLSLNQSRDRQCVIVGESTSLTVLFCNPFDEELRAWLESLLQADLNWILVSPGDLNAYISRREQGTKAMDSVVQTTGGKIDAGQELDALSLASISQDSSPVVKLVHSTLYDALRAGASDIHIETGNAALEIRYRIDGVLMHVASVTDPDIAEQVISRVKVMSELDIAERRIPQDGRFKSAYDGRPIDFRVSIMPSSFGEDAVLRVLDKQAVTAQMTELTLGSLGFADSMIGALRKLSERPYGMLLVTGPTGSGKTTTLYAALSETNSGTGKVVTIEDPVEYELPGVLQIPVNEKKGLTFARGLRSILRHDPDKIMVGEIRDPETAQIAIQSALTGHLVFTTVHANNVFDVLSRFTHMGVDPYSFVSALNGILAQRLLRVVCSKCAEKIVPTTAMLEATGESLEVAKSFNWKAGRGCSECRGTGYKGRRAVGELLVLSDELREAIVERVPVRQLKELARKEGLKSISHAAMDMVREGLTTIEEVNRVTTMA